MLGLVLGGIALISGLVGAKKSKDAKKMNDNAQNIINNSENRHKTALNHLEEAKKDTTDSLEKLGKLKLNIWNNTLNDFLYMIKQIKENSKIEGEVKLDEELQHAISQEDFNEINTISIEMSSNLKNGTTAIGTSGLVAFGVGNAISGFSSIGVGTALSSISISALNGTVAWLGGGAIATTGAAATLLGGIVLGPALAIFGGLSASKAKENYSNALSFEAKVNTEIETISLAKSRINAIEQISIQVFNQIQILQEQVKKEINISNEEIETSHIIKIANIMEINDILKLYEIEKLMYKKQNTLLLKLTKFIIKLFRKEKKNLLLKNLLNEFDFYHKNSLINFEKIDELLQKKLKINIKKITTNNYIEKIKKQSSNFEELLNNIRDDKKYNLNYSLISQKKNSKDFFDSSLISESNFITYSELSKTAKEQVYKTTVLTQHLKSILEDSIILEDGSLNENHSIKNKIAIELES